MPVAFSFHIGCALSISEFKSYFADVTNEDCEVIDPYLIRTVYNLFISKLL